MTPKQERLRKAYEFKIGKERTSKLSDDQILLLSKYYNSLNDSEQSTVDNALAQGKRNDLTDMADAFISENEQDVYEPSDIIKQYDKQFDEAVAAYNKKVEDFKEKEDKRIAGMFQYDKPIGPQAMQGPKEPPVQGPRQASKDDEPWESEVQDQLGTKLDNLLEQIRNEPLPQPSKTKRRKSKGKKKLSRKSYTAQELGVGESLNLILENVVETREALFKLYKLEKERFEFKKKIDKKLTQQLAAKKRERNLEKNKKKEETFLQKKMKSAKTSMKQGLLDALISGAILFALPLIIDGIKGLLPGQRNNKPPSDPNAGSPTSAADQSGGLGQPDVPPGPVPIPVEEYKESDKTESESKPNTTAEPVKPSAPSVDPGSFGPFNESPFGTYTWNTGGPVPGPRINKDIVPAMLTPGEFVMSKGAVNKFGLNVMMSMNKAGGGTNRPTYKGMLPGYQGGGFVPPHSPDEYRLLDAIAAAEGTTGSYGTVYGGKVVDELARGELTIGEVLKMMNSGLHPRTNEKLFPTDRYNSDATGRYQLMSYVLREEMGIQNLTMDMKLTPQLQDKIILNRIKRFRGVTPEMLQREGASDRVIDKLAPEFASFPNLIGPDAAGNYGTNSSYYGQGGKSADFIRDAYNRSAGVPTYEIPKATPPTPPTPAFNAPGSEVRGYQGPPTPGSLRRFSGVGNIMEDLNFNLQVLGAERRTRSATRGQPPGTNPRRNMNPLQQFLQMLSPTPAPEPPEFIAPTITKPVGRRSPQQSGS